MTWGHDDIKFTFLKIWIELSKIKSLITFQGGVARVSGSKLFLEWHSLSLYVSQSLRTSVCFVKMITTAADTWNRGVNELYFYFVVVNKSSKFGNLVSGLLEIWNWNESRLFSLSLNKKTKKMIFERRSKRKRGRRDYLEREREREGNK